MADDDRPLAHWYVENEATLRDVERSADLARENAGQRAIIHHHAQGEPCVPGRCLERVSITVDLL